MLLPKCVPHNCCAVCWNLHSSTFPTGSWPVPSPCECAIGLCSSGGKPQGVRNSNFLQQRRSRRRLIPQHHMLKCVLLHADSARGKQVSSSNSITDSASAALPTSTPFIQRRVLYKRLVPTPPPQPRPAPKRPCTRSSCEHAASRLPSLAATSAAVLIYASTSISCATPHCGWHPCANTPSSAALLASASSSLTCIPHPGPCNPHPPTHHH
jgi:hypothetical protein